MRYAILSLLALGGSVRADPRYAHVEKAQSLDYDYVIVGGGVGGVTLANRLTETGEFQVLLLEAGSLDQGEDFIVTPGQVGNGAGTKYDWNITSTSSKAFAGRELALPMGRGVGGSSLINQMVYTRGTKGDFDRWEQLGNKGVNWDLMLKNFKLAETFTPPDPSIIAEYNVTWDPESHGFEGYVHSTYSPFFWPSTHNAVQAARELGIPIVPDGQSGNGAGGFYMTHSQKPVENTRSSARAGYYDRAAGRTNLHLLQNAHATKVVFDGKRAVGVEYGTKAGASRQIVRAKKEVILSAGALHTPQILQLSGIGKASALSTLGIKKVVDLPAVGQNLQDHPLLATVFALELPLSSANLTSNQAFADEAAKLYQTQRTGPLANPGGEFIMFLPTSNFTDTGDQLVQKAKSQSVEKLLPGTPKEVRTGYKKQHQILTDGLTANNLTPLEVFWNDGAIVLGLEHPFSRGQVTLKSADPFAAPKIDLGSLSNPIDMAILVEGVRFARRFIETKAMSSASPFEIVPGQNVTSTADIEAHIRENVATFAHYAGTASMGPRNEGGVVDSSFRVYGVTGLRIVDASVIPLLPAAHTSSTVYALAEMVSFAMFF
ncbi:hypothetical protein FSHL1_002728 [Fusarium sambucinum]